MTEPDVELVYFVGCPNVDTARARLRSVLPGGEWRERNLADAATPDRYRRFGSPTILVDGRDVARSVEPTEGKPASALACKVGGAPTRAQIRAALGAGS